MGLISSIVDLINKIFDLFLFRQKRALQAEDDKRKQKQTEDNKMEELLVHMLSNFEKLLTAGNIAGQKGSLDKVREVSEWFDANCLQFRHQHPFNEFEFLKKFFAGYTSNPELLAPKSLEMFERLTQLRIDINEQIKILHDEQ